MTGVFPSMSDDELERFRAFLAWEREQRGRQPPELSVAQLWSAWYPTVAASGRGPNIRTHRQYVCELEFEHDGHVVCLGDLTPSQCTILVLEAWRAKLRTVINIRGKVLGPDYRDQIRLSLQAMFTYHLDTGTMAGRNPLKGLPREKGWKGRTRMGYPTREFLETFTPYCRPLLADILWLSFEAGGMRRDEMRLLLKTEHDPATRTLVLQGDRTKNEEPRTIILTVHAAVIVERWSAVSRGPYVFGHPHHADGRPIPKSTLWNWLEEGRTAAQDAGISVVLSGDPFCIHHARHGFVMRMQGIMPESWTADQVGHSTTEMIHQRYGKLRGPEAMEQARVMLEQRKPPHQASAPIVGKSPRSPRP